MKGLKYVSFHEASGYGHAARAYLRGLIRAGVPLTWQPLVLGPHGYQPHEGASCGDPLLDTVLRRDVPYDTVLVHTMPEYYPFWRRREPGKRLVGYTTWETTELQRHWLRIIDDVDLLLVPSQWNAAVFRKAGGGTPVRVIPHIFEPPPVAPARRQPEERFVFYTIAPWAPRKAPWRTVEAYWRAFSRDEPVLLVIKTDGPDWTRHVPGPIWQHAGRRLFTARRALRSLERQCESPAPVQMISGILPERQIHDLHDRGDCYVSLCASEGWGLGAFDAAGRGTPVIMTGFGGQLDFLPPGDAYLVDYRLEEASRTGVPVVPGSWAVADVDHAAALMRGAFEDLADARERGLRLQRHVLDNFTEAPVIRRLLEALEACPAER